MKGIYSALLGAFDAEGRVNEVAVHALVRHNIERCGVDGLYVNGSTGENFLMTTDMKRKMFKAAAEATQGDVKLIAQIGSTVLEEALELSEYAKELEYDAVSAVTPFYYKFTQSEIRGYYRTIAEHSALPLVIYYIPTLTGVSLSLPELTDLLQVPNVIGIKFSSNDYFLLEQLRYAAPDKLIYSGFDETLLSTSVLQTDGAIGSTYNIIGHWAKRVHASARKNELSQARAFQHHINKVVADLLSAGLYGTIKAVCELRGIPVGSCKPPMHTTTQEQRTAAIHIAQYIDEIDAESMFSS